MATLPPPIQALLSDPQRHLAGTDAKVTLPLSRTLLNEILAARPEDVPVEELLLDPDDGNLVHLHLAVKAPVIGSVKRRITFQPGPAVSFPDQPWLQLDITDGFGMFDKPILKLMQGQIAQRLPKSVQLTSDHLRLHIPALLKAAGYQSLVPLIRHFELKSIANRLVVFLRISTE